MADVSSSNTPLPVGDNQLFSTKLSAVIFSNEFKAIAVRETMKTLPEDASMILLIQYKGPRKILYYGFVINGIKQAIAYANMKRAGLVIQTPAARLPEPHPDFEAVYMTRDEALYKSIIGLDVYARRLWCTIVFGCWINKDPTTLAVYQPVSIDVPYNVARDLLEKE